MLCRRDEADRTADAGRAHLAQRVGQEWMPVAHADEHRQRASRCGQSRREAISLRAGQVGDWRDAAEELVVMGNFFDALWRHASAAQDISQEWADVVEPLGAAEGDEEDGVEHREGKAGFYDFSEATFIIRIISIGKGKMIVEFFSAPISVSVCRYRSVIAAGSRSMIAAACASLSDAISSPSA